MYEESEMLVKVPPKKKSRYLMIPVEKIDKIEDRGNVEVIFVKKEENELESG